ncbi:hypothetical protein D3C78_1445180 [compost metagenome]
MPSLCSMEMQRASLRAPGLPFSSSRNLGTTNREMPFTPAGASGRRASTRWMTLSVIWWSPQVMKIFWPVIR